MITQNILAGAVTAAVHVTEYQMISPNLARVLVSASREMTASELTDKLSGLMPGVAPVRASFRWLNKPRDLIGYMASVPQVRSLPSPAELKASFRVMAGNLYLDASDQSLWEVKDGAGGKYMTRNGTDELATLIESSRQSPMGSAPRFYQVQSSAARKGEIVAFVHDFGAGTAEVDYGFCVESGSIGGEPAQRVLSSTTNKAVVVRAEQVVGTYVVDLPKKAQPINAAATDAAKMIEYYKQVYSYSPEYLEQVTRQIEEMHASA